MANIVLSSKNRIDSTVSWYGNEDAATPLTNLANATFAKYWSYAPGTNADGNTARFAFKLTEVARAGHIATCRHNFGEGAQVRKRSGLARFDADLTTDNPFTHDVTPGGGANGTRTNEYGVMVAGTCPRYEHDRRYFDNGFKSSDDMSQADWVEASGAKKYSDGKTVDFAQAGAKLYQQSLELYNDSYEQRWQVRLVSGDGSFCFQVNNGSTDVDGATQTATSDWQWFRSDITTGAATSAGKAGVKKLSAAGVLQFRRAQIRRGTFPVGHHERDKYRKTTTLRRYRRLGAITEAAATNSLLHSADLTNAAWASGGGGVSVTSNVAVAPDGTTTMDRITASAANGFLSQNIAAAGTSKRAATCFFRKDASTSTDALLLLVWTTGGALQTAQLTFNPSTAAVISNGSSGATVQQAGIDDFGDGFYRAYLIATGTDAANTVVQTRLNITTSGQTVTCWGFQNEPNFVTTYIPTGAVAVTRTVDTVVVENATWFPYAWNAAEGTVYHEMQVDDVPADVNGRGYGYFRASDGTVSNQIVSRFVMTGGGATVTMDAQVTTAGSLVVDSADVTGAHGVTHRKAFRYRPNDFAVSVNGSVVSTDTVGNVPTVTQVDLMDSPGPTAYLRRVTIWPTGKSDADLVSLSTNGPSAVDYDSGWDDALQMTMAGDVPTLWGHDYDILKTFTARAVEMVRVEIYDPAKTSSSTPFEAGRVFMGKFSLQPAVNAEAGVEHGWIERSTSSEAEDGALFFNERTRPRETAFAFPQLTRAEGAKLHEMQGSGGIVEETLFLPDPDDEAECQRYGFVGRLRQLDRLRYPMFDSSAIGVQMAKKR